MNAPPEVLEVLRQWVRKAEHDLEAANRIMASKPAVHSIRPVFITSKPPKNI
jgi:hypothetical protein